MNIWTYGQALDRVNHDLDLDNEAFIQDDEMAGYFNEGLDVIAAKITKLNRDYMKKRCTGTITAGQSQILFSGVDHLGLPFANVACPPDLYANKVRSLVYSNGPIIYLVKRMRGEFSDLDEEFTNFSPTIQDYRYEITNPSIMGYRFDIFPNARETGSFLKLAYLRNIGRIPLPSTGSLALSRATTIDVPEFVNYLIAYVKCLCLPKEGDPRFPLAEKALEFHEGEMITTLKEKVVDNDNRMEMDLSYYGEHQ
jgi:hypothetical protein